jgi:acetyl esterase/lipase
MNQVESSREYPDAIRYASRRSWDETLRVSDDGVYWLRRDPASGRSGLRMRDRLGNSQPCLADEINVRSAVQGYGGGAYCLAADRIVFVDGDDGAVHMRAPGQPVRRLTEPGPHSHGDLSYDAVSDRVLCLRETMDSRRLTQIVSIPLSANGAERIVASSSGFLASPRVSPCGRYLAWIRWGFPAMPWNASALEVVALNSDEATPATLLTVEHAGVSVIEPSWSKDGTLYFLDDRSGWWCPYACRPGQAPEALIDADIEFGFPPYKVGLSTYALCGAEAGLPATMLAAAWREGKQIVVRTDLASRARDEMALPFEEIRDLQYARGAFWFVGTTASAPPQVVRVDPNTWTWTREFALLDTQETDAPPPWSFATDTRDGMTTFAHLRMPACPTPPAGYRLVVNIHGGPTGVATRAYDPVAQFWVDSGFAYLEVNHRGSTGFGRAFRESLNGHWGVVEGNDCIDAVADVCRHWPIDASHVFVRGNSAGGFTVLSALTRSRLFRAAGCYYGVTDLSRLCTNTHKFESQYTFSLIGPYPAARILYEERSPLRQRAGIEAPVIFFQGALDTIVDSMQTRRLADAMRENGQPSRYVEFPDEGHGFSKVANLAFALELERNFYLSHSAARSTAVPTPFVI